MENNIDEANMLQDEPLGTNHSGTNQSLVTPSTFNPNYKSDKASWVVFKDRAKKNVKLRKYIASLATVMGKCSNYSYNECRDALINEYNIGGVRRVSSAYYEFILTLHKEYLKAKGEIPQSPLDVS